MILANSDIGDSLIPAKYGVAFNGEFKLVRKATGYEEGRRPIGTWVRRLREPTFPVPLDHISDPLIPLTRPVFGAAVQEQKWEWQRSWK